MTIFLAEIDGIQAASEIVFETYSLVLYYALFFFRRLGYSGHRLTRAETIQATAVV